MNLQIFVCFHKKIHHEIYKIHELNKMQYITYYGVKEKDPSELKNVIYEYELPEYNSTLQKNKYNEGSCIYHVYTNKLYNNYDYIGFCQYDMKFNNYIFKNIHRQISNNSNTIFYFDFFKWAFYGGQRTIVEDFHNIPAGLESYNNFFNTNYNTKHLISNKMIICNTFIIPKKMYEKMMSWLIQYFNNDVNSNYTTKNGMSFNPGHIIEALTSMFLSLEICEGATYRKLNINHNNELKLPH
jgi:hypothetical protein